jgi:hypothetical protein
MTGHGGGLLRLPVNVKRMFLTFADELAAVRFKMSDEVTALHTA